MLSYRYYDQILKETRLCSSIKSHRFKPCFPLQTHTLF